MPEPSATFETDIAHNIKSSASNVGYRYLNPTNVSEMGLLPVLPFGRTQIQPARTIWPSTGINITGSSSVWFDHHHEADLASLARGFWLHVEERSEDELILDSLVPLPTHVGKVRWKLRYAGPAPSNLSSDSETDLLDY